MTGGQISCSGSPVLITPSLSIYGMTLLTSRGYLCRHHSVVDHFHPRHDAHHVSWLWTGVIAGLLCHLLCEATIAFQVKEMANYSPTMYQADRFDI